MERKTRKLNCQKRVKLLTITPNHYPLLPPFSSPHSSPFAFLLDTRQMQSEEIEFKAMTVFIHALISFPNAASGLSISRSICHRPPLLSSVDQSNSTVLIFPAHNFRLQNGFLQTFNCTCKTLLRTAGPRNGTASSMWSTCGS